LYIAQNSFTQLKNSVEQTKAMLDAWSTDENKFRNDNKPVFSPGRVSAQGLPPNSNNPKDYLWLLSGLK